MSRPADGSGDKAVKAAQEQLEFTWSNWKNYSVNDGPKAVLIAIWILANLAVIGERVLYYTYNAEVAESIARGSFGLQQRDAPIPLPFHKVTLAVGYGIPIARGAAASLKLNCACLFITVLRNFLSALRTTCLRHYIPFDKNITFHKGLAWTILFMAVVHMTAHYRNYENISSLPQSALAGLSRGEPGTGTKWLQAWPFATQTQVFQLAFTTVPGITGHILMYIMVLMYTSAIVSIRRPMFEVFWYTHHFFIAFFFLLCVHGLPGLLESPNAWMWMVGPGGLYALERLWRVIRGNEDTVLAMAISHPGRTIELRMKKATFLYVPGQYLFLNCPTIARHEWHPFTITSAPEEDFVSLHIRIVGDWTGALSKLFNPDKAMGVVAQDITTDANGRPILKIDGPFGAASEEVFDFKTVILCGAGIGVTPFSSILKSIRYKLERQRMTGIYNLPIKKVYFYWISRDREAFEWFGELLHALERDNVENFLEIHTYLTGALKPDDIRNVMYGEDDGIDAITGLESATHYGRPNWPEIFDKASMKHQGEEIGVFFCGPGVLSKTLYKLCRKTTMMDNYNTRFKYQKENF